MVTLTKPVGGDIYDRVVKLIRIVFIFVSLKILM